MRVGIVGKRGLSHAAGFRAHSTVQVTAVAEADPMALQHMGEQLDVANRFHQFEDMLDHVDAVFIGTPMNLHARQSIAALNAGKHVLCEVTACVTMDEVFDIHQAAQASGKVFMLAENYCYLPNPVLVRELVKQGRFGEPYYAEGEYVHDVKAYHHFPDGTPTWRAHWQVGRSGNTYCTHSLGPAMQWILAHDPSDRPESVVCLGSGIHTDPEHPHEDTTDTLVKLKSGRLIRLRLDMMSNRPHNPSFYSLQGTCGVYEESRFPGESARIWLGTNPTPGPVQDEHRDWVPLDAYRNALPEATRQRLADAANSGHGGGDYLVALEFVESALGEKAPDITLRQSLEWTAVGLCSQESILQGGAPVKVPQFS